jgi:uncharacterized protein YndB with AHSA1/START domain
MQRRKSIIIASLAVLALFSLGTGLNPDEEFKLILTWHKPVPYPPPTLAGLQVETLSRLLDSGNLQWYMPRPEKDKWEAVVGLKVHAPPQAVWEVITDYPALCRIMPDTYLACATEYRHGNTVKNNQKGQTTVIKFAYKYDIIDMVTEDPPYHHHVLTISGLDKRELDVVLVPVDNGETLLFMRYYLNMAALGYSMQAVLAVMPMVEPPTAVGAANYHSRAYKNEAERRVGYKAPPEPRPLDFTGLDRPTLKIINDRGGGIIRETPQGKIIDAIAFTFIAAPPDKVYDVLVDFGHYPQIFTGSECKVEKREGNQVTVLERTSSFSVLFFSFGYEIHARYTLDPPYHVSYAAIDGTYQGSHGEFRIVPIADGKQTLLFHRAGINLEKDNGLTAQIAKSGAFPLENMLDMLGAQSALAHIKKEAEARQ